MSQYTAVPEYTLTQAVTWKVGLRVHDNWQISIPIHWGCNSDSVVVPIRWDHSKTTITSAKIYVKALSDRAETWLKYYVNDFEAVTLTWPTIFDAGQWREGERDVSAFRISNGDNTLKAEYCKGYIFPIPANVYVTAVLTLEGEGDPPITEPPKPPEKPWEWWQYLLAAGVAISAIVAVGYFIKSVRGRGR